MKNNNIEKAHIYADIATGAFVDEDIYKMEKAYTISMLYYEREIKRIMDEYKTSVKTCGQYSKENWDLDTEIKKLQAAAKKNNKGF